VSEHSFALTAHTGQELALTCRSFEMPLCTAAARTYRGVDKSLARPGMKRLTGHLQPRRNWPTWASNFLITHPILRICPPSDYHLFPGLKKTIEKEVGRSKNLSALRNVKICLTDKIVAVGDVRTAVLCPCGDSLRDSRSWSRGQVLFASPRVPLTA
jgi:hypothetical protein